MVEPHYLILGLGKTGHSIAAYLSRQKKKFILLDTRENPPGLAAFQQEFKDAQIFLGSLPQDIAQSITEIICSPGVPLDNEVVTTLLARGIPLIGDIECFAREVQVPVVAITGTNGKSTVTTLVGLMAKTAGRLVAVAGNIGAPVLDVLSDGNPYDLFVLELSSFQLDLTSSLAPIAATILNITPDHLDRHHSVQAYIQAKQRIYRNAQYILYNREDTVTAPIQQKDIPVEAHQKMVHFGLDAPSKGQWGIVEHQGVSFLACGEERILSVDTMHIKGRHNWQNALAACALAEVLGIPRCAMMEVLKTYTGLPHRTQWVRTLDGVDWIDDSKGTNVGATISAISGLGVGIDGKIILIAGGQGKGADFSDLRTSVSDYVRALVLMGEDKNKLNDALIGCSDIVHANSMKEAVDMARNLALPGDIVLLSPACASFDMFRDYNHRGEVFAALVRAL